jgi:O-antigen/teichoic acid export membrane protein
LLREGASGAVVQGLTLVSALVLSVVLARFLGAAGYGVYAYAIAVMNLLIVFAEAGTPTLLVRELAKTRATGEWMLLRGALTRGLQFVVLTSVLVAAASSLVLAAVGERLDAPATTTAWLMLLLLPLATAEKTLGGALRGLSAVTYGHAVESLVRPAGTLFLVAALFWLLPAARTPGWAMTAQVLAALCATGVGVFILRRVLPPEVERAGPAFRSAQWLKSALPFTVIGAAILLTSQADIIMLGWFAESAEVGVYRVAAQGASLTLFGLQVANMVLAPHLARLHAAGDTQRLRALMGRSATVLVLAGAPFAVAFLFAGGEIASVVFGGAFASAHLPLAILSIAYWLCMFFGPVGPLLSMTGHEHAASVTLVASAVINVALNGALIPVYGAVGASIATGISLMLWNLGLVCVAWTRLGIVAAPRFRTK